jgi:hypothetical protein
LNPSYAITTDWAFFSSVKVFMWLANCYFASPARPKMPSGANVFEISDIQEVEELATVSIRQGQVWLYSKAAIHEPSEPFTTHFLPLAGLRGLDKYDRGTARRRPYSKRCMRCI